MHIHTHKHSFQQDSSKEERLTKLGEIIKPPSNSEVFDGYEVFECVTIGEYDVRCNLPRLTWLDDGSSCGWIGHIGDDKSRARSCIESHWNSWSHAR